MGSSLKDSRKVLYPLLPYKKTDAATVNKLSVFPTPLPAFSTPTLCHPHRPEPGSEERYGGLSPTYMNKAERAHPPHPLSTRLIENSAQDNYVRLLVDRRVPLILFLC